METKQAMIENLEREFRYYLQHHQELVQKYSGKFLVIKGEGVIGVFDSDVDAIQKTSEQHELGTFLVQWCSQRSMADPCRQIQTDSLLEEDFA